MAFLLSDDNRKKWLENRLEELVKSQELVEYTGRLFRQGKASISERLAGIFERVGLSAQRWQHGMEKLRGDRLVGRFFAASRTKLREIADRIGARHLVNLTGCPIR
jgi:hypothetical protein